ncbi:sugar diacid recognition domain-containing protein [Sutcliffiella horikoshii]|uniref:CdaR family transcriptional regulator n=1 Tax=Sutcliffiella horikoshii TaxID=79883 RepID=UPI001CBAF574|nr:sugar diacid recognition domain-containing protein [Sutcliffiella horikoshii]UAL48293.1 helix-turn-helix domain-containing protein [Sutcliffiella horikoshii]
MAFLDKQAQLIVLEMEKIIEKNINIMNNDGIIIASKDSDRIGTFHEGARNVIERGETVMIYPEDTLLGSKPGVNMPIYFHEELIGVIGITGHPNEVRDFAKIIQKMTEVMVKEAYVSRELDLEKRAKELYIQEWMRRKWDSVEAFVVRGQTLSIQTHVSRQAFLLRLETGQENETEVARQEKMSELLKKLQQVLAVSETDLITLWKSNQILLLRDTHNISASRWHVEVENAIRKLRDSFGVIICGVGREYEGLEGAVKSFDEARLALDFVNRRESNLLLFKDLGIESIMHEIPEDKMDDFIQRFFPFFLDPDHKQLVDTLKVFFEHNQSIAAASEALFIHKNTLQYRLKKMKELTGYDPRIFQDAVLYWVGLVGIDKER